MSKYDITLMPGDGIGPELTEATLKVLDAVQKKFNIKLNMIPVEAGDKCLEKNGVALPQQTIDNFTKTHVCLKGPVGETAADVIVKLRIMFDLYANLRPIKTYPSVPDVQPGIDMIFVRENTEDVYRGIEFQINDNAVCMRVITKKGSEKIAKKAFEIAKLRKRKEVVGIHKANVMRVTCGLFKKTCAEVAKQYPEIKYSDQYVDAAAMRLIRQPQSFDVILITNMFGDILSDEAAQLIGGLGMAPGANVGDDYGLFEPIHGSAPDIVGKGIANPCSMVLSAKMMLDWLGERNNDIECFAAAQAIEDAVTETLRKGVTVPDLGGNATTMGMAEAIAQEIINKK
ncbi:MAG: isocitrate/isopropylmalate dehydrogenase family protein [Candidatus Bathyarchaeota archaeon]|jgi:3-isopropylmalate dehydrogenase